MKRITKCALSVALLVLAYGMVMGLGCSDALSENLGGHQINFLGATYDSGTDATTFTYQVTAHSNYPFDYWILELNPECFGAGDISGASEPYEYVGPDSASGLYGIKFTTPYAAGQTRTVSFRLPGDLSTTVVRIVLLQDCTHWWGEEGGPDCPGEPTPPPPEGEGKSPGYWGNQLAVYLELKNGKLKEPNVADYLAQHGYYDPQAAYDILNYGGDDPVEKLHRQLLAAKLSTAAGYLWNMGTLLEDGQHMVAHPEEFTDQEILDAKDLFESLHD